MKKTLEANTGYQGTYKKKDGNCKALSSVFSQEAASLALFSLDHAPIDSVENGQSSLDP